MRSVSVSSSQLRAIPRLRGWLRSALCAALLAGASCSKDAEPASSDLAAGAAGTPSATSASGTAAGKSAANGGGAAGRVEQAGTGSSVATGAGGSESTVAGRASQPGAAGAAGTQAGEGADAGLPQDLPIDFTAAELAEDLAKAVCAALRECLGTQKLTAFVGREQCETRFSASLAQQDFASLEEAAKRGRVKVVRDALEQCYSDTRALGCGIQSERLPASCQRAIAGTAQPGEPCSIGADCTGDSFCPNTACSRVCTPRAKAAGSCKRDEECVNGLICLNERCGSAARAGEACAGTAGAVCALGTSCVGSTKTQSGTCQLNADVQVGALGEACTPGGTLCQEGLSCAFDGGSGFNCQAAAVSGGVCHLALPGQCPNDAYCSAADVMSEGRCEPLPVEGAACVLSGECAGGHICLASSDGKGVCWKFRNLGEACTRDAMCRSGRCADGHCAAPLACD